MLRNIHVRNFAIIDEIEIEFADGMTVLTGETGAGKSILVDALGLVLGERGSSGLVRKGAKRAEFTAEFDVCGVPGARDWLEAQMLDVDGDCNIRRVIGSDGRSRAFINGNNVPLQSLKALGEMLLDIHGQHFHQSLARRDIQRSLLDHYGELGELANATGCAFDEWQTLATNLAEIESANDDRDARLELLRFQISELEALDLHHDELPLLIDERSKLQNSGRIADGVARALDGLFDSDASNAQSLLADATQTIETLVAFDAALEPVLGTLRDVNIQVTESVDELRRYADSFEMDSNRQNWVEERLDAITDISRKHRIDPEEIGELLDRLTEQRDELINAEEHSATLRQRVASAEQSFRKLAKKLSVGRKKAASAFSVAVTEAMSGLGMPGGAFEVGISPRDKTDPRAFGLDNVEYLISPNPGQPAMPLAKIASGGELSRMSLAIQVIASDGSAIPTMVFDEVDSGVGGGVAEMVGLRLRELGQSRQVFCVTHLPQVASLANHHCRVIKVTDGKSTKTVITPLSPDERVEEIARMLGGVEITQRTRDHAKEMLARHRSDVQAEKSA